MTLDEIDHRLEHERVMLRIEARNGHDSIGAVASRVRIDRLLDARLEASRVRA